MISPQIFAGSASVVPVHTDIKHARNVFHCNFTYMFPNSKCQSNQRLTVKAEGWNASNAQSSWRILSLSQNPVESGLASMPALEEGA